MYYLSRRNGERICQSSNIREYIVLVIIPAYTINDALYVSHRKITHIIAQTIKKKNSIFFFFDVSI